MLAIGFALTEVNYALGTVGALIAAVSVYLVGSVLLDF